MAVLPQPFSMEMTQGKVSRHEFKDARPLSIVLTWDSLTLMVSNTLLL